MMMLKSIVKFYFNKSNNRGNMKQKEFDRLMEGYKRTHESSLLEYTRDLYMVVTFICVAYLVYTVLV